MLQQPEKCPWQSLAGVSVSVVLCPQVDVKALWVGRRQFLPQMNGKVCLSHVGYVAEQDLTGEGKGIREHGAHLP